MDYNWKNGSELNGLSSLKKHTSSEDVDVKEYLELDDAYQKVRGFIENDEGLKKTEEAAAFKIENSISGRAEYRRMFEFYQNEIKNYLRAEGTVIVDKNEDGTSRRLSLDDVSKMFTSRLVGYNVLEDAFEDPEVTDIYCNGWDKIFVEKNGRNEIYPKTFASPLEYKIFTERILRKAGGSLNRGEKKIADFEYLGNRGNAIDPAVTSGEEILTLRKHHEKTITLEKVINDKVMDPFMAEVFGIMIEGQSSVIIGGRTGSGKTTTMRALLDEYIPKLNRRAVVIEDTPELFLKNPNTVSLHTFTKKGDESVSVSLRDLTITALRMKPCYEIIGEVRGVEAEAAVDAMETGHSCFFTIHGGTVWNISNRLITKYLQQMPALGVDVVERIVGTAVNFVAIQDNIPKVGRKITSIHEIGYDFEAKRMTATLLCKYNKKTKSWEWHNGFSEEIQDILLRGGVDYDRMEEYKRKINALISEREEREAE